MIAGVFYLIVSGIVVDAILFGAITLVIGYLIGRGQSAAGLYFNSRKNNEQSEISTENKLNQGPTE